MSIFRVIQEIKCAEDSSSAAEIVQFIPLTNVKFLRQNTSED